MKLPAVKILILFVMLLGLPLAGVFCSGGPLLHYLEFPPITRYVQHPGFSVWGFAALVLFVLACTLPFLKQAFMSRGQTAGKKSCGYPFPWWGWAGLGAAAAAWALAWTRFDWFGMFQLHTFTPLWLSYIVIINALTVKRTGTCMMLGRPRYFLILFPASAVFWWFFEYLNRFVQNWYYVEVHRFSPAEYVLFASLSFCTVLPAVLGTREYLRTFSFFKTAFKDYAKISTARPKILGAAVLILSGAGLAGIGIFPGVLFPLLWVSPLLILVSLQALFGEEHLFSPVTRGDWSGIITASLAGLVCGFFWELWNYYSLAKWVYAVPYVHVLQVFEMPIAGFAGYLPFGLECAAVGWFVEKSLRGIK